MGVTEGLCVGDGVSVPVTLGLRVGLGVPVDVRLGVAVTLALRVCVCDSVPLCVVVWVTDAVRVSEGVKLGVCVGVGSVMERMRLLSMSAAQWGGGSRRRRTSIAAAAARPHLARGRCSASGGAARCAGC